MRNSRNKHLRSRHRAKSPATASARPKAISMHPDSGQSFRPSGTRAEKLQSIPLLDRWPDGYAGFRLDGNAVIIFATGKPDIHINDAL
jgi:hypothetical protein